MSLLLLWAGVSFPGGDPEPQPDPGIPCADCPDMGDDPCIVGRGNTEIWLLDHCGNRTVCNLTDHVSFYKWSRELDDDSELEVSLHLTGDSMGRSCCECLENTRTWRNELVVIRDGKTVWGPGPIVTISIQREIAHLVARDITAWLDVRVVHNDYSFEGVDLATIAQTVVEDALLLGDAEALPERVRDACILEHAQFSPTGKLGNRAVVANQQSAGEILRQLASEGLDFTVLNRSLIVGGNFAFGPIGPLHDDDFVGNIELSEHGLAAATKWFVSSSNAVGEAGGVDDYFGLIERAVEGALAATPLTELNQQARERLAGTNPPPFTINIPSDGFLSPKAPVCMKVLVPGTLIDISVQDLCRGVDVRQRITAIQVRGDSRGEQVAITIAPMSLSQLIDVAAGEDN